MVSQFGDYRCEGNSQKLDLLQSFIYIGGVAGVILGAILSEILAIKKLLTLAVFCNLIGVLLALLGPSIEIASIGLFLNMAAISI